MNRCCERDLAAICGGKTAGHSSTGCQTPTASWPAALPCISRPSRILATRFMNGPGPAYGFTPLAIAVAM